MFGLLQENVYFGIAAAENMDLLKQSQIIQTLSNAGHKVTKDYIKKTFNVELEEVIEPTQNNTEI